LDAAAFAQTSASEISHAFLNAHIAAPEVRRTPFRFRRRRAGKYLGQGNRPACLGKAGSPSFSAPRKGGGAHLENAPDRGRSPSAAREQTELLWKSSASSGQTTRCEPGRFAVRHRTDRGRSPSAACRLTEADCKNSVLLRLAKRCEPGRFAVRQGQRQDARKAVVSRFL